MSENLREIIEEQKLLLETIDTQIWYLTDEETYGKVNKAHSDFLGVNKSDIEYKKIGGFLSKEEAEICRQGNKEVFNKKKKIETRKWRKNSEGQKRLLSVTKNPKLNEKGEVEYVVCSAEDITEKNEKDKIIREQKDFLSSILEVQSGLVVVLDSEGQIVSFNNACEKLTGYTEEEVKGRKVWDLFIKKDERGKVKNVFHKLKNKDYPNQHENYWLTKKGEQRLITWSNNVILDNNNNIKYIVGTGIDITERKEIEEKLKKTQKMAALGSWEFDLIKDKLTWSEEIYRIFGLEPEKSEDITYERFLEVIHPEDRNKVDQAYKSSIAENRDTYEIEHRIIRQDNGEVRFVREKCEHLRDNNGKVIRSSGMAQDITEIKKREEELEKNRQRYQTLFEKSPGGIMIEDETGKILEVNEAMTKMSGYSKKELEGDHVCDKLTPNEDKEEVRKNIERILNGEDLDHETKDINSEGKIHFSRLKETRITLPDGKLGILSMQTDITQERREKLKSDALFENSTSAIVMFDSEGNIVDINDEFTKVFSYKLEEVKGKHIDDVLEQGKKGYTNREDTEKNLEGKKTRGEGTRYDKDGNPRKVLYYGVPIVIESVVEGSYAIYNDITKRKKQEQKIKSQKDRLNSIIEGTNAGTWEWNVQTGEIICNEKWEEMLGYELNELEPITIETWKDLTHPEDSKKSKKLLEKIFSGVIEQYDFEVRMKHKKGHWVWTLGRGKIISWTDDGRPHKMFGVHIDISKQKRYKQIIKELHKIAIELQKLDNEKEICQKTIKTAREILNFDLSHILLAKNNKFVPAAVSEGMEAEILSLDHGIAGKAFKNNESYLVSDAEKDPDARPTKKIYRSAIAVPIEDIGVFLAISTKKNDFDQKNLELAETLIASTKAALDKLYYRKELEYKSFHDGLTNLYNRRFFEEELERLDTKRQLPISIIMADLNGLKLINDSYGHEKGDEVLVKTAEILKETLRAEDILARQGGDEFAVLLPKTNNEQLNRIIKRIKNKVERVNNKRNMPISIALGSAIKKDSAEEINEVLKKADDNMYQNKLSESKSSKSKIIKELLNSLSAKSNETKDHSVRMRDLAVEFGNKLRLAHSKINRLSLLASMHDIGKTSIPEDILKKPGQLTDKEWEIIKRHSEQGYKIASASEEFILIAEDILAHHEHWDGSGYPRGLKGEEIPYLARIISIIDAYDVMTNERPYSKAISKDKALAEIKRCAGSQFDPELAQDFIDMMEDK